MLTPDEMSRIEEEERKRHAEEEYRKTVRSSLKEASKKRNTQLIVVLVGILAIVLVLAYVASFARGVVSLINPYVPKTVEIASGDVTIQHRAYIYYRIEITPAMRNPVVTGNFTVAGGSGNDVLGVIATEADYMNWINGHAARAFWNTQGRATAGKFNVRLAPGTYYLAFSNRFSLLSDKYISLKASLNYEAQGN